ncbi:hypothetical protein JOC86_002202 [Bacillus pakistanensis]|uniref:Uncharacterized protein n=1 Tax=Rossellomorea pakistanensis TaxID=992288 RepID=A0ABS2NCU8_9BACI|nr:hypothetical protein [Bacillus pakistanensis]MBM7585660.1 hypothetical protein [Bacillus pakistanensis]
MKKINWLIYGAIAFFIALSWFAYQQITNDTHEGMSIIPEHHKDIPLFEGLKPTEHQYVVKGNKWNDIYNFYLKELPALGWKVEYEDSALNDGDTENDWSGFYSRWRKEGFDGELWISANYNEFEEQTEVIFDKTSLYNSTTWIEDAPESICIYQNQNDEKCSEIEEKSKIEKIVRFINDAIDWDKEVLSREKTSVIELGNIEIKVFYENDKEIYFQSEKGTKMMKPDPDFFKLTNL